MSAMLVQSNNIVQKKMLFVGFKKVIEQTRTCEPARCISYFSISEVMNGLRDRARLIMACSES